MLVGNLDSLWVSDDTCIFLIASTEVRNYIQLEILLGIHTGLVGVFLFCWLYVESVDPAEEVRHQARAGSLLSTCSLLREECAASACARHKRDKPGGHPKCRLLFPGSIISALGESLVRMSHPQQSAIHSAQAQHCDWHTQLLLLLHIIFSRQYHVHFPGDCVHPTVDGA